MANTGHAKLSPSAASRWMNCPGSIALGEQFPPRPSSVNAAEGSIAHELGYELLTGKLTKEKLVGLTGTTRVHDGHTITVDEEMVSSVIGYFDRVVADKEELIKAGKPAPVQFKFEERVKASSVDGELHGTADCVMYQKGNRLIIRDLKYGKGVPVEAVGNKQLLIYAIGAMDSFAGWVFDSVELIIDQPRAPHPDGPQRRWVVPVTKVKEFAEELKAAVAETRKEGAEVKAGAWCRWCPAESGCPAKFAAMQEKAQVDFLPVASSPAKALPAVSAMSLDQMAAALSWSDEIASFFDAIRERLKTELNAGNKVPGWKLVEGKTNRVFTDEKKVVEEFEAMYGKDLFTEPKLKSPAQLEKIVGKKALAPFTKKPQGTPTIAPESDPRPALNMKAQDDFAAVTAEAPKAKALPAPETEDKKDDTFPF